MSKMKIIPIVYIRSRNKNFYEQNLSFMDINYTKKIYIVNN